MEWLLLFAVIICFMIFISHISFFKFGLSPQELEIKPLKGLKKLSDHLEHSLSKRFMENVEDRVKRNNKLKENEYDWRLLDLKRYFILTAFLKETPMFSAKVDELWHEMLMFTREYDDFSIKYLGSRLHHSPNISMESDPDLRGFFDWIYSELFFIRDENVHLYNGFFKHPVDPDVIEQFRELPENELIDIYFKQSTTAAVSALVSSMKKTASKVKDYEKKVIHEMMKKSKSQKNYNAMIVPFLSVSYFHYHEFTSYMKISNSSSSSGISCGAGESCSDHSSCSNSSCSSCGGGGD